MCGKGLTNGGEWWYYGGIKNAARRVQKRNIAVSPLLFFSLVRFLSDKFKTQSQPGAQAAPLARGGGIMNELTAALKEELNVDTAFTLPIFGGIDIPESIAVSWGIMAFLVIVSILLTRNLKVNHISKRQAILETAVVTMDNFFKDLLGEAGKQYVPYLITVALYIACSNLIGIIGLKPPTKDLNVTAALAIMSIVLIEYSGIHAKGGKRFVHSLAEPIALMTPMNILEIAIRPTSLCMRLFGNVLGAFVIMELIKLVVPVFVPAIFSLYFDLFDGLIQTYVFVFLTSLFMKETME